ncbi:M1 family metallopeptidase [Flavobacterium sp. AC]|uniref:M1 family metallopeptidase n=1 Tax=Flavobacterium azizsancarii TaxID=2961580 RepID=A0ABT4W783_9FLAO|nr:M1 family metallopeptidase [Flavobacterium azizsancarii]MDA6068415.1 M1 family metallopeptidase [Flavobacterium azizsancarii]
MKKRSLQLLLIAFVFLAQNSFSQELYMPRNIKESYADNVRSMDGKPGKNYWQNHGKYTIALQVNADTKIVSGTETIVYENNSNDTLKNLRIRFVNNIHKKTSPRAVQNSEDFFTDGLTITALKIEGIVYKEDAKDWGTVEKVKMKKPLPPHSKITIDIDWNYPLSKLSGREGQIDNSTFFVAYSYPRVSVFDDYNKWDDLPHTSGQEFYNDFNDYTYSVEAPKNYVVYGTGDLLNPDEVLQPEFASRLKKSYTTDEVLHIANEQEMKSGIVTTQNEWNVWKFEAKNITDVCFGLSDHYLWDAGSVVVDKKTNRRASIQAAYDVAGTDFVNSIKNNQYALDWFSNNWPGIPYPFSKMTAFQGFADMEYPMMCNDSQMGDPVFAQLVQDHEVAHTYFPFYMGINETRYAFMDEGWATTFEYLIGIAEHGKEAADKFYKEFRVQQYINDPSTEEDQPIITMSSQLSDSGYGNNSYGKASLSYIALKDLLGDDLFKKSLHAYMDKWNGKHPIPWDYFNSFNTASGKNLNWFFNNWFFTNNYIDISIKNVAKNVVSVENVGGFAIPFDIIVTYSDKTTETIHQTPAVWQANQKRAVIALKNKKEIKQVTVDGGIFMDATPKNNTWSSK